MKTIYAIILLIPIILFTGEKMQEIKHKKIKNLIRQNDSIHTDIQAYNLVCCVQKESGKATPTFQEFKNSIK